MWMELIRADSKEALEMVRTTTENPAIQKGIEAVYALNADTILREQIRQRDKAIRDYENDMAVARTEGRAEGEAIGEERGRTEGRADALKEALESMIKNGISEEQAKKILGLA